jgi:glycosyltransferase involved in cell wall biosynthesis
VALKHIILDASNVTGAGAQAVGLELLPALLRVMSDSEFIVLLPNLAPYTALVFPANSKIIYVKRKTGFENDIARIRRLLIDIPVMASRISADLVFSLGDLSPFFLFCPRITYLQQSLLVYDYGELAGLGGWSYLKRFYLTRYLKLTARRQYFVVQTPVMADRLVRRYQVDRDRLEIIPLPVPIHVASNVNDHNLLPAIKCCNKPLRLLFLSAYYRHKNHLILPAVAEELRRRHLTDKIQIFTTLDNNVPASTRIREQLGKYKDVITNLGHLPKRQVAAALRASVALFLPTLVESYGNIYLEAMLFGLPILTSDRDFAHWICGDLAVFFDPLSPVSIVESIMRLPALLEAPYAYKVAVRAHLARFPKNYNETAEKIAAVLYKAME